MEKAHLDIGFVTDEISRDLWKALEIGRNWGITRFELREGGRHRFPRFTDEELTVVDEAVRGGAVITAVSPGIFKCYADDARQIEKEITDVLPRTIDLAAQFGSKTIIVFGFERRPEEDDANRGRVLRAFERAAARVADAGMRIAIENEPDFWVDGPAECAAIIREVDNPALRLNWDPANMQWGGTMPTHDGFEIVKPYVINFHVKDFTPDDKKVPWRPVGSGAMQWEEMLGWVARETDLKHVTIETHCEPLERNSSESLAAVRRMLQAILKT